MKNTRTYQKFLRTNINLALLGAGKSTDSPRYFCTPKGASVFGWAGVDGIHYCFIRGFGEMVFAVSPQNTAGNYVHPLAENFGDFLRLLLACKTADALEQAWQWDQAQFDAYVKEVTLDKAGQAVLTAVANKMELSPMAEPWQYIRTLQADFDYGKIRFTADYYDLDMNADAPVTYPEWKVYFEGSFCHGCHGRGRAGTELPVGKDFLWDGEEWLVPSVYSCGKGLAIDFLKKVPACSIQDFMDKWHLGPGSNREDYNSEQQLFIEADNPLDFLLFPKVQLNNRELDVAHSVSVCWNPVYSECDSLEAQMALRHYGLDPAFGWMVFRSFFPWKTKRKPQIKSLSVQMSAGKQAVPGPHFRVKEPGSQVLFTCPATGKEHTLTVQEYASSYIDATWFSNPAKEYPNCCTIIGYTITPVLPKGCLSLADCSESDRPRELQPSPSSLSATSSEYVTAIVGGADGPSSIFFSDSKHPEMLYAASALHFEPAIDVEWRMIFHEQKRADITVKLI